MRAPAALLHCLPPEHAAMPPVAAVREASIRTIELTRRKGLPGVVVWYYRGLERAGAFERLTATVFARPADLPWPVAR